VAPRHLARFDNNAVFNTKFTKSDVSGDYFHPSVAGQAKLASVSWAAGYTWVTSPPPNVAPTASFTSNCTYLTCTFTDASTDPDGAIAARSWTFGDGATSTATNPAHTYAAAGTYTVGLTVTDNDGATASASSTVTASTPPPIESMWVGSLAGTATSGRNSWTATVTVGVADAAGPVAGVSVTGNWSAGSGALTCTTDDAGRCSVTSSSLNKKTTTVRFTIAGLTMSGWAYDSTKNVKTFVDVARP
jgi:PKD repeat protein